MKAYGVLAFLLFLSFFAGAESNVSVEELEVVAPDLNLNIANCHHVTGPVLLEKEFYVHNPCEDFMAVTYEYYNLPNKTWEYGGKSCNIGPGQYLHCPVMVNVSLGGTGNGTFSDALIRFTGTTPASPNTEYKQSFVFKVDHVTSSRESEMLNRLENLTSQWETLHDQTCLSTTCCTQEEWGMIENASVLLNAATQDILVCGLSKSYEKLVTAEDLLDTAQENIDSCLLSGGGGTPTCPSSCPAGYSQEPYPDCSCNKLECPNACGSLEYQMPYPDCSCKLRECPNACGPGAVQEPYPDCSCVYPTPTTVQPTFVDLGNSTGDGGGGCAIGFVIALLSLPLLAAWAKG